MHLDQVRHRRNGRNPPEAFAHTLATRIGFSHCRSSSSSWGLTQQISSCPGTARDAPCGAPPYMGRF
ncbi:hypothetical protein CCC_02805 [Paramagnetospirillum magnetotacticum MS-1]|uniref:Uncharacterized protein n=1 Tax=Paramagnetospirillum magnetotacticum MS-1 TaxID=272627 RepID=A0A0C2V4K4_PARME|nr:hypothetical protein CCC_02805 [Paramagnetospirillum magnetotacticum MS-1]